MLEDRKFSQMYQLLVEGEDDILGHIAYSVYKQHKMDKIRRFVDKEGRSPTDEDLASFMENAESENQCRFYKERALSLAREFLNISLSETVNKIEKDLKDRYDASEQELSRDYSRRLKDSIHGYWYGVGQSLLASFLFVAGGILFLFATGGWARIGRALVELSN